MLDLTSVEQDQIESIQSIPTAEPVVEETKPVVNEIIF